MTEPKYPRAWGLFHNPQKQWADPLCASRLSAEDCACSGDSIVELIPLPEHAAIVAAAVAAEREAIRIIVDRHLCQRHTVDRNPLQVLRDIISDIKIREVPE